MSAQEALLVDPGDGDAIATAMVSLTNPTIAQPLIQNSRQIIHRYSWQQSAQMHLELYRQLVPASSLRT